MTKSIAVLLLLLSLGAEAQVRKVTLPCESTRQDISPNGEQALVRCKEDRSVRLVNIASGKEERSFTPGKEIVLYGFSDDSARIVVGYSDGKVEVVPANGQLASVEWKLDRQADDVQFLAGNKIVVVSPHERPGQVWDISAIPKQIATLTTDFDGLNAVAISPNGKLVATCGSDTIVRLWDSSTWKLQGEYHEMLLEPFAAAFTTDSKSLLFGGADKQITILDVTTLKPVGKLPRQTDPFDAIAALDLHQIVVRYFDEDGRKPPHILRWNPESGSSEPVAADRKFTGGGIGKGRLWLADTTGKDMEVWSVD